MFVDRLECSSCSASFASEEPQHLCRCGKPLLVRYRLDQIQASVTPKTFSARTGGLWRYAELLPLRRPENRISLGEAVTPVLPLKRLGSAIGIESLFLKDEGLLPTGSFKARGAAVGVSRALELGVTTLAMPTNGNAGGAWAAYSAAAGIEAVIVMPKNSPLPNRVECLVEGAELYLVDGDIGDAGGIVERSVDSLGCYDASTLKEPYRIEGKKTIALELVEQFGWEVPEVLVYPTGGGVGLIGIHKALGELQQLGWLPPRYPRYVAVQSEGCAPIVQAWESGERESRRWKDPSTVAFGINVAKALGDFLVLEALYQSDGCAVGVSDEDILDAQRSLANREGLFVCPEGAATLAAVRRLQQQGWIRAADRVVLINTGTGLKYTHCLPTEAPLLQPGSRLPDSGRGAAGRLP